MPSFAGGCEWGNPLTTGNIIETLAEITPGSPVAAALARRANIVALSDAAHEAVLRPREPGGLSHAERAALAQRMARLHAEPAIAAHYGRLLDETSEAGAMAELSDPARIPSGPRHAAIARHTDMLTRAVREASRAAIDALREAGVSEPDIVRLSELAAFVNYQIRVIIGLRLLREAA